MKRSQRGFTLVEIMTVMAIISMLAALSVPNLLRMRVNANEAAAQATLRTIHTALTEYNGVQTPPNYPVNLTTLANANPPYITQEIANNSRGSYFLLSDVEHIPGYKGYIFRYYRRNGNYTYEVAAIPADPGNTGTRYFMLNASGNIMEVDQFTATGTPIGGN